MCILGLLVVYMIGLIWHVLGSKPYITGLICQTLYKIGSTDVCIYSWGSHMSPVIYACEPRRCHDIGAFITGLMWQSLYNIGLRGVSDVPHVPVVDIFSKKSWHAAVIYVLILLVVYMVGLLWQSNVYSKALWGVSDRAHVAIRNIYESSGRLSDEAYHIHHQDIDSSALRGVCNRAHAVVIHVFFKEIIGPRNAYTMYIDICFFYISVSAIT